MTFNDKGLFDFHSCANVVCIDIEPENVHR